MGCFRSILRVPLRAFLLLYFLLPLIAIGIMLLLVRQVYADVEPVVTSATTAISSAAETVETELGDLAGNFQPLVSAVNTMRNALNTVVSFLRNTVNVVINAVEDICNLPIIPGSCNWGGIGQINIPPLVDLSFLNTIGDAVSNIADNISNITNTLTTTFATYQLMIWAAFGVLALSVVLTYILVNIAIYRSLITV